jgi:hypothetical protein
MKNSKSTIAKSVKGSKINSSKIEEAVVMSTEIALIPKVQKQKEENVLSQETLDTLLALNISETTVKNADRKTIFKKEFNNKKDRTKCRTKFLNAVERFLLFTMHKKQEQALECLADAKSVAKHYYNAEDSFKNYLDYCSENMDEAKKNVLKAFIVTFQELRRETGETVNV